MLEKLPCRKQDMHSLHVQRLQMGWENVFLVESTFGKDFGGKGKNLVRRHCER